MNNTNTKKSETTPKHKNQQTTATINNNETTSKDTNNQNTTQPIITTLNHNKKDSNETINKKEMPSRQELQKKYGHLIQTNYLDANFPEKMRRMNIQFEKKSIPQVKQYLTPILKIHEEIQMLEKHREKGQKVLCTCWVRRGKGFEEEPADLLSFHDIDKDKIEPKNWPEQQCKVRFLDGEETMVGLRRVKKIITQVTVSNKKQKTNEIPDEIKVPAVKK